MPNLFHSLAESFSRSFPPQDLHKLYEDIVKEHGNDLCESSLGSGWDLQPTKKPAAVTFSFKASGLHQSDCDLPAMVAMAADYG